MNLRTLRAVSARLAVCVFAIGAPLLAALPVSAQSYEFSVLIDSDNNPATGCTVSVPGGSVSGVDARLQAQVSPDPANVSSQQLSLCSGASFDAPQTLPGAAYPVGIDRVGGALDVIELGVDRALLGPDPATDWGLTFLASSPLLGAVDVAGPVTAVGLGQPPLPPPVPRPAVVPAAGAVGLALLCLALGIAAAWTLRRHPGLMLGVLMIGALSSAGVVWAAGYLLDGEIGDWDVAALLTDSAEDPTQAEPQVDIRAVFAAREGDRVFFRFDVTEIRLPVLLPPFLDNSFNVDENSANGSLVGSVRNSSAGLAGLLRFAVSSQTPSAGFSVDTGSGEIRVADSSQLDFESRSSFTLGLDVSLQGLPGFSLPHTLTIAVNDLNETPQIAAQSFSVLETAPNGTVVGSVVATDSDAGANGQLSYSVIGGSGQTVFAVAAASGQITVSDAAALDAGAPPLTLQVQVADGGAPSLNANALMTITVANVNDAPSFTAGAPVTVNEDSGAYSAAWATAISDNDGGTQVLSFEFTANSNAALFAVAPAISPSGVLSFTPAANVSGVANLTVVLRDDGGTASGGADTSAPASFSITVNAVNDAPSFSIPANAPGVLENAGPQTVAGFASAISAGPADESGQSLSFAASVTGSTGNLAFASAPALNASTGTVSYTAAPNTTGSATVSAVLSDNGGTANGGVDTSAAQVFTITVANVNDAPSFTAGAPVTVNEDSGAYSAAWATAISDNDGGTQVLSFEFTANSNAALFTVAPAISPSGVLSFTPAANVSGVANLTVVLRDDGGTASGGVDTSAPASFSITVNAVNDAPSFSIPASAPSVLANAGAQTVVGFASAISAGAADESAQALNFTVSVTGTTGNLVFSAAPAINPSTGTLSYTAQGSTTGTATVSMVLSDDGGTANGGVDTSAAQVFTLDVLFVNVAPSFTGGGNISVAEDSGAYSAVWATNIDDGDPSVVQGLNFIVQSNDNPGLFAAAPTVNATSGALSFTPAANAAGVANLSLVLQDDGGTANGGADTSPVLNFSLTVTAVNDPPVVIAPSTVAVTRHVGRSLGAASAEGLLANVSDPADGAAAAPFSATVQTDAATAQGGRVTVAADGSWSYQPPASAVLASDSFDFQVCDSGVPGSACTTATATLALSGTAVWFVDAAAAAGGDGTLARPFTTLAAAATAAGSNGRIFVISGSYSAGASLQAGQWLIGQGISVASATSFDSLFGLSPPAGSATRPSIGGTRPLITTAAGDAITLATGNSLRGVEIGNTAGIGLVGSGFGTLSLGDNRISGSGQALSLSTGTLTEAAATTAFDQISSSSGSSNIVLSAVGGSANFGTGALSGATGTAFQFSTGSATLIYSGSIAKASAGRMIDIDGVGFANLSLSGNLACSGLCGSGAGNQGLRISGRIGGTINLSGAAKTFTGTSTNPAVQLLNNSGATISVTGITNLGTNALRLAGTALAASGGGTLNVNGELSIATTAARSLQLSGMTLSGTMTGSISSEGALAGGNPAIDIQSSASPTGVSFGQELFIDHDDAGESGGGINLVGNTGSYSFNNVARVVSTNTAALRASNAGTLTLGNVAAGALANNGGIAIDVQNTTIGAGGLNAVSVQSLGGANGILLNTTGTLGSLVIIGSGGTCTNPATCTGGYIANTSSHGIQLSNTRAPSITRMRIENTGGSGISGTEVNGFSFASGSIDGSGTAGGINTSNIAFNTSTAGTERNVFGVVSITDSSLSNARYHGIDLFNFNGTLSAVTIAGNTITSSTSAATSQGSGVRLIAFGSASTAASVTRASIANNTVLNFPGGSAIRAQGGNANAAGPVGSFGNAGNATNVIAITGNSLQGASAANRFAGEAIVTLVDGSGEGNFDVSNNGTVANPVQHSTGTVITQSAFGDSTATATVNNNVMSANNSFGSQGIGFGTSFTTGFTTTPTLAITTSNNTVQNVDGNGILGVARDASATLTARIQNNVVAAPLSGVRPGIRVDSGNAASGDEDVCVRIDGNSSAGSGGSPGIGLRKQGAVTTTHDFRVHAMAATASPGVETHVNGQNPAGNGTLLISATSGFSSCTLP